jgi:hypothetical protein
MTRINAPAGGYELGGYREYAAPASLRHVAEVAWSYAPPRGRVVEAPTHRVLPETGISLCFISDRTHRGSADRASLTVMGPIRTVRQFVPEPAIHMEGVRLKPECARWLLGVDAGEYADVIDADTLAVARRLPLLRDRLAATTSARAALHLLFHAIEQGNRRRWRIGNPRTPCRARPRCAEARNHRACAARCCPVGFGSRPTSRPRPLQLQHIRDGSQCPAG